MTTLRVVRATLRLSLVVISGWIDLHAQTLMPGSKVGVFRQGFFWVLQVRINDPGAILTSAAARPGDPGVTMLLSSASAPGLFIPVTSRDAGGRTYSIVIPYDTPHKLIVQSAIAGLKDAAGRGLSGTAPIGVLATRGVPLPAIVVNVVKAVKP